MKTRDPVSWMRWDDEIRLFNTSEDKLKKLIVQNPDPKEDGCYGGINEKGVAYVSTFVKVAENQVSYIRRPYVRLILDANTAAEAVEIIKSFNPRIGGNMFVADQTECFGIEAIPSQYYVEKIDDQPRQQAVKTNHFHNLDLNIEDYKPDYESHQWTLTHYERASELLKDVKNIEDMQALLRDRKHADKKRAICTTSEEEDCYTHSAFIFDTKNICAYYSQGNPLTTEFKKYDFA